MKSHPGFKAVQGRIAKKMGISNDANLTPQQQAVSRFNQEMAAARTGA